MCNKQSEIEAAIARVEDARREKIMRIFKGEESPRDDFEKELVEATKKYNTVVDGRSENTSADLEEALKHLKKARELMPTSIYRDELCDIPDSLEIDINRLKQS